MLPELDGLWEEIAIGHQEMFALIDQMTPEQLLFKSEPDRWSILQVLQHVVLGIQGMCRSEADLRDNPLRKILKPGAMVGVVRDILVRDVQVNVPDPSMEPDGKMTVEALRAIWRKERRAVVALLETVTAVNREQVMFSHAAAGPLTPLQMLEIAEAHLQTHRRQIDRICAELPAQ